MSEVWTVKRLLEWTTQFLTNKGVEKSVARRRPAAGARAGVEAHRAADAVRRGDAEDARQRYASWSSSAPRAGPSRT